MYTSLRAAFAAELQAIQSQGLWKSEAVITSPQGAHIDVGGKTLLNFCANNYLGLSSHPEVMAAAHEALRTHGFGLSSVRFICGTQDLHKQLEASIARFVGMEDAILYAAAFDANGGLFEPLLGEEDAIVSDALNHASIIDGIRLCKARRYRYRNNDMNALEAEVSKARSEGARRVLIVSDGAFSMDGVVAQVDKICDIADRFEALVMIDECHATGFMGTTGRGTHELQRCMERVDIVTGTFGKALGGASGGFTAARKEIVALLRQRSRPYLFSNTLAPAVAGGSLKAIELISASTALRDKLQANTTRFRSQMTALGFTVLGGGHPISPVLLGDAQLAQTFSQGLREEGVLAVGFFYPVVPEGQARIRVQLSAVHEEADVDAAVAAFAKVGRRLGVIA
ncbi:MAG: glycine C-acetyltransferase [Burkholderiales bacterium]